MNENSTHPRFVVVVTDFAELTRRFDPNTELKYADCACANRMLAVYFRIATGPAATTSAASLTVSFRDFRLFALFRA